MSSQRGNTQRSRPQKYQNNFAFKNNLHDTSHKTKTINSIQITNVCERCKKILEWKIKYKKYKPLKAPAKCNKCAQKAIKHSYHTLCGTCAKEHKVCPKCGDAREIVEAQPTKEEQLQLDGEMQKMIKSLSERKRRTFLRYVNKQTTKHKKIKGAKDKKENESSKEDSDSDTVNEEEGEYQISTTEFTHEHLLDKLKSLMIDKDEDNDDFNSDISDDDSDATE